VQLLPTQDPRFYHTSPLHLLSCPFILTLTFAMGAYRDKLLTTTQTQYLRAVETLAKVRRMTQNTPSLQINIAQDGGKQINVQGEVGGQKVP